MIRYNIELIRKAIETLDKIRRLGFEKTDQDKLVDAVISLEEVLNKYDEI